MSRIKARSLHTRNAIGRPSSPATAPRLPKALHHTAPRRLRSGLTPAMQQRWLPTTPRLPDVPATFPDKTKKRLSQKQSFTFLRPPRSRLPILGEKLKHLDSNAVRLSPNDRGKSQKGEGSMTRTFLRQPLTRAQARITLPAGWAATPSPATLVARVAR